MDIVLASDLHGNLIDIPKCDLFILSGDISPHNINPDNKDIVVHQHLNWINKKFSKWIERSEATNVVLVAGNHDFVFQDTLTKNLINLPQKVKYLENSSTEINGIKIWGTPWTPWYGDWAFVAPREENNKLELIYSLCPDDTDIIVSHGPPKDILDTTPNGDNAGSMAFRNTLSRVNPKIATFGHIHSGYGARYHHESKTYCFNTAIKREYGDDRLNLPMIFNYNDIEDQ